MAGRRTRLDRISRLNFFRYPTRKAKPPSPREKASFLQIIFVSWLHPLLNIGMKREITERDLYPTLYEDQSDHIADKLEIMWGNHVEDCKARNVTPSLVKVLRKAYGMKFFFFGLFSLAEEAVFRMIQVIAIGYVLDYFEGNYLTTLTGTILFGVGGILLGSVSFLISFHWSIFGLHHACTHIRIGLTSLVYRKILHLNQTSLRSSTVGQIVTMIASDLHRFDRKHIQVNYIWVAPVHLVVVIYILYFHYHYGVTSLIGLFALVFFTIIQYIMAKKFIQMRQKRVDSADQRIRAVVEIINAFYTIKVHCWERFFEDKAMENRQSEIKFLKTTMFLKLLNTALGFIVTKTCVFLTLMTAFYLEDPGTLHSKRIFVTLVLYEHVRVNSMLLFPQAINDVAELLCSCRRIASFLLLEELEPPTHTDKVIDKLLGGSVRTPQIEVQNMSCRWLKMDGFQLKNISFKVQPGQLVVVAGPVASGKSTLIASILGEIVPETGHILVIGRVAYVPQTPAIFPGSIRRNIIFGYGTNDTWYNEVIKLCDLEGDLEQLPEGDQSLCEFTTLTSSQRAKICIARALYANADVYILDDPLHALDIKYHRYLMETVIRGALADKAVLLVSHQIHFMEEATDIILINEGAVQSQGSYGELLSAGIEFYPDVTEEDEFNFEDESDDLEHTTSTILTQFYVPELTGNNLRRRNSLMFEIDDHDHVKRVSQGYSPSGFHKNRIVKTSTTDVMSSGSEHLIHEGSLIVKDEDAMDATETVEAPARISFRLYYEFLRSGASRTSLAFMFLICMASQGMYTLTDIWIESWAQVEEEKQKEKLLGVMNGDGHFRSGSALVQKHSGTSTSYALVYSGLVLSIVAFSFCRSYLVFRICLKSSSAIFNKLLKATVEATMEFFDSTCAGHAINRLSKDMVMIDDLIPPTLLEVLAVLFEISGALFILAFANPWFIIPSGVFFIANVIVYKIYHLTAADLKRIEGRARSPVYSHLSKTLQGVTTIRAFGQEQAFVMIFDRLQDMHTASWFLFLSAQSWLAVIIDCVSVFLIASICLSFFYVTDVAPGIVGLVIAKMIELSILVQFAVAEIADTETQMISVERVLEFVQNGQNKFEKFAGPQPPEGWPSEGRINLIDLSLKPACQQCQGKGYLKHINLNIAAGQWIGIIGKAGSGKTTLMNSLFRTSEPLRGYVMIDGVDIAGLGLHNLRSRISIIPQNPCMFQGTVRQNIDPLELYTDEQIWHALSESNLFDAIQNMESGLNSYVTEYGINFSAGQRQFICLARALLEKNKIICCDEPTSSLDAYSQVVMMCKLKEYFENSTMLLVSHRIHSVVDCDRIIVMDEGEIVEDGEPYDLLTKKKGPFYELVCHVGPSAYADLLEIAKDTKAQRNRRKSVSQKRISSVAEATAKRKSALIRDISLPLPNTEPGARKSKTVKIESKKE